MTEHNTLTGLASDASVDNSAALLNSFEIALEESLAHVWHAYAINPEYSYAQRGSLNWDVDFEGADPEGWAEVWLSIPSMCGVWSEFILEVTGRISSADQSWELWGTLFFRDEDLRGNTILSRGVCVSYNRVLKTWKRD